MDYKNRPANLRPPKVTQSATYTGEIVERIYALSSRECSFSELRDGVKDQLRKDFMQFQTDLPPHFEDLVFLPANLTRLTIDAYRELCQVETRIGETRSTLPMHLASPVLVALSKSAAVPSEQREAIVHAVKETQTALIASHESLPTPDGQEFDRLIELVDEPSSARNNSSHPACVALTSRWAQSPALSDALDQIRTKRSFGGPLGVVLPCRETYEAVQSAAKAGLDFAIVNGSTAAPAGGANGLEDEGWPRIAAMYEAVRGLRSVNLEEEIDLLYHGGVRGGADAARALCLGAKAVVISKSARIAMELARKERDRIETGVIDREGHVALMAERLALFIKSIESEATVIAKACGKTRLHNLEPEDLRALTAQTAAVTGVPLVGKDLTFDPPES